MLEVCFPDSFLKGKERNLIESFIVQQADKEEEKFGHSNPSITSITDTRLLSSTYLPKVTKTSLCGFSKMRFISQNTVGFQTSGHFGGPQLNCATIWTYSSLHCWADTQNIASRLPSKCNEVQLFPVWLKMSTNIIGNFRPSVGKTNLDQLYSSINHHKTTANPSDHI